VDVNSSSAAASVKPGSGPLPLKPMRISECGKCESTSTTGLEMQCCKQTICITCFKKDLTKKKQEVLSRQHQVDYVTQSYMCPCGGGCTKTHKYPMNIWAGVIKS
jgi:hypothetical protein